MSRTYIEFFPNDRPARSALAVGGLVLNARVEIECIATVGIIIHEFHCMLVGDPGYRKEHWMARIECRY